MFARVAIDLALDRLFTYEVPKELEKKLAVGQLLSVPFGHRTARGFVMELGEEGLGVSSRNRPLRVGATRGEATEPSEMRLSRSDQVWVSEANCEAAARPRASAERPLPNENIYYLTERGTEVCDAILEELV